MIECFGAKLVIATRYKHLFMSVTRYHGLPGIGKVHDEHDPALVLSNRMLLCITRRLSILLIAVAAVGLIGCDQKKSAQSQSAAPRVTVAMQQLLARADEVID